jgi:hypothetical protein
MEIRWRTAAGTVGLRQVVYQSSLGDSSHGGYSSLIYKV